MAGRPDKTYVFKNNKLLVCGVPSPDGSEFGYFICDNILDVGCIRGEYVTWFIITNIGQLPGCVVIGPACANVFNLVRDDRPERKIIAQTLFKNDGPTAQNVDKQKRRAKKLLKRIERLYWSNGADSTRRFRAKPRI